jgi:glycosyltransferase involved in cell wall biosynthesis
VFRMSAVAMCRNTTDVSNWTPRVSPRRLRVLFFVEGFIDIRFVVGLSEVCELTMAVPQWAYVESGLKARVAESGATLAVQEITGGRLAFQARSLFYLWSVIRRFDVVLSQEVLRGSLNATVVGKIRGVPVVTYLGTDPLEYFRCRRERRQIGVVKAAAGEAFIRTVMSVNGRLADRSLAVGPYLYQVAARSSRHPGAVLAYGVDIDSFRPATEPERAEIRVRLSLPAGRFVILLSSRMSHEKDPETVLQAAALARARGLDAVLLNLGGGYQQFLSLAHDLSLPDVDHWVLGRPAVHPMKGLADYYRAVDLVAQASLAEGLGLSPLEALACGTPVVATAVGGMAIELDGFARLTPRRDPAAMADQILWVATHAAESRAQALRGREHVCRNWNRQKAFAELGAVLESVARG